MKYKLYKYQRRFLQGFILAAVLSIVNSVCVIKYGLFGGKESGFAALLPIVLFFAVSFCYILYMHISFLPYNKFLGTDTEYIKDKYPELWEKLYPYGKSWSSWHRFWFIRDRYDDGQDERLNRVKQEIIANTNIFGGGFLLLILVEIFILIFHYL